MGDWADALRYALAGVERSCSPCECEDCGPLDERKGAQMLTPPPACPMCGDRKPWMFFEHPVTKVRVCPSCLTKAPEGWVPCHGTHKKGERSCIMCRSTPGFLEVM